MSDKLLQRRSGRPAVCLLSVCRSACLLSVCAEYGAMVPRPHMSGTPELRSGWLGRTRWGVCAACCTRSICSSGWDTDRPHLIRLSISHIRTGSDRAPLIWYQVAACPWTHHMWSTSFRSVTCEQHQREPFNSYTCCTHDAHVIHFVTKHLTFVSHQVLSHVILSDWTCVT